MHAFDVVVIGAGTAGLSVAHRCRESGKKVAIVDHQPVGGTCALRGCDPKKILVGAADAVDIVRRLREKNILRGIPVIQWKPLLAFKRAFTNPTSLS